MTFPLPFVCLFLLMISTFDLQSQIHGTALGQWRPTNL